MNGYLDKYTVFILADNCRNEHLVCYSSKPTLSKYLEKKRSMEVIYYKIYDNHIMALAMKTLLSNLSFTSIISIVKINNPNMVNLQYELENKL